MLIYLVCRELHCADRSMEIPISAYLTEDRADEQIEQLSRRDAESDVEDAARLLGIETRYFRRTINLVVTGQGKT